MSVSNIHHALSPWTNADRAFSASSRTDALSPSLSKAKTAQSGDVLELSAEAQAAADANGPLSSRLNVADLFPTEDELKQSEAALKEQIQSLFAAEGIDTSKKIDLRVGADGHVVVANQNDQAEKIQKVFRDNPSLRDQFVKHSAQSSLYYAAKEAVAFQQAYARDPVAAVAQYSYLFDGSAKPEMSLTIENQQFETMLNLADGRSIDLFPDVTGK